MTDNIITLAHGAGGAAMSGLIDQLFRRKFGNFILDLRDDSAVVPVDNSHLAFTTDSYVVDPLFFPGGDIGMLAVYGTVNDLACMGAKPMFMSVAFILEEGLEVSVLDRVVESMRAALNEVDVMVVTGDTKVVPKGAADRMFINTSGIGAFRMKSNEPYIISGSYARPGDAVILSGRIADHGMAVMSKREGIEFESEIVSDVAPLAGLVSSMLDVCPEVHTLRDPTRGGLASILNEIAVESSVCLEVEESAIPVGDAARAACELLGIDPLYVANEGKMLVVAAPQWADAVLDAMHSNPFGRGAVRIGTVLDSPAGVVHLITPYGQRRMLSLAHGEQLPRIC